MSGPQGTLGLCGLWAKEEPRKVSWLDHTGHSGTQEKGRAHPRGLQGASNQELWGERGWSGRDTAFPWPRHGGRGTEAAARRPSLFLQAHLHNLLARRSLGFLLGVASWLPPRPTHSTHPDRKEAATRPLDQTATLAAQNQDGDGEDRARGWGTLGLLHGRWARRPRHTHGPRQPVVERTLFPTQTGDRGGRLSSVPTAWTARGGARWWWPCPSPMLAQFPSLVHPNQLLSPRSPSCAPGPEGHWHRPPP